MPVKKEKQNHASKASALLSLAIDQQRRWSCDWLVPHGNECGGRNMTRRTRVTSAAGYKA
jgi:hypothetical protein